MNVGRNEKRYTFHSTDTRLSISIRKREIHSAINNSLQLKLSAKHTLGYMNKKRELRAANVHFENEITEIIK